MLSFEVFSFPVPFKRVFRHSSASRKKAENFIVKANAKNQIIGWGESCPREYVTGETIATCKQFLRDHLDSLLDITDLTSLQKWVSNHAAMINQSPSAFCAIELAILDALGKQHAVPVETLLGIERLNVTTDYSAVLGDSPHIVYWLLAHRYRAYGFRDIKIKLSGSLNRDRRKLLFWKSKLTNRLRVRIDANNLWTTVDECVDYLNQLPSIFWAVEEPLKPRNFTGLASLAQRIEAKIILDESVTQTDDISSYSGDSWIVNLRISKLGGILRTLDMARAVRARGLKIIVGSHVGETSILTRAAVVLTQYLQNLQLATEGAFGTHLLTQDLVEEPLQFARDGQLPLSQTRCLAHPGLGLEVQADLLKPY